MTGEDHRPLHHHGHLRPSILKFGSLDQPPLLNTLNLSSSASNSNSLLRRKENLVEKVKGSEMAKKNRKSGKENVKLGTQEREASQGRQVLQKGKKKTLGDFLGTDQSNKHPVCRLYRVKKFNLVTKLLMNSGAVECSPYGAIGGTIP